jgi:energy-coupling factor transport system permease protein
MAAVKQSKGLKLTDILVTVAISVVFGVVYKIWGPMYDILKPFGLHAEQLSYGMWFIAGTFAYLIIRKPGVAILAELAAASVETFFGSEWGVSTFIYGVAQGLGAEIFFALFRYRIVNLGVVSLAAIGAAVASLIVDYSYGYIESLTFWNYCLFIGLRLLGSVLIAGVFAYLLSGALEKTGVLSLLRPVKKADYDALG